MVIPSKHLRFQIVTDFVYQVYLQERLATDKIPNYALFPKVIFMAKNIVNSLFCYLPRHPFFCVFTYEIAILTSKLAVLRYNERDVLSLTILPYIT